MSLTRSNDEIVESLLALLGYKSLYPPQQLAVENGIMSGANLLVTTPTASGKTLVATLAIIGALERNQKTIYLTPLRALASEKYEDLRILERLYPERKIRILLSIGEYDSPGPELASADVIVLTNEKMDSLFRHGAPWLADVGLFISDEVHLIGDKDRGPTLEMMLTTVRNDYSSAQLVALSATVANSNEIAEWLNCKRISSTWRPTKLVEGVFDYGLIKTNDGRQIKVPRITGSSSAIDVALQALQGGGQSLIFAETRKRAVSLAVRAADVVSSCIDAKSKATAKIVSSKLLASGEDTEPIRTLAQLVKKGVGFHHAGLGPTTRQLVEDAFKNGTIKLLAATPTLAAGVNLPARRVVVASVLRYDSDYGGNVPISVLDYKQLSGRAGRPRYDAEGESIIVTEHGASSGDLYDHYVLGTPEPLRSRLLSEKALRFHVLSSISSHPGMKQSDIMRLFAMTLFARQNSKSSVEFKVSSVLEYLEGEDLVASRNDRFIATDFGKRISLLYIDPLTGVEFKKAIQRLSPGTKTHTLGFLHLISSSTDFYPKLALRRKDYELVAELLQSHQEELLQPLSEYDCSRSLWAMSEWIDEATEVKLNDMMGIEPGDLHRITETARWLTFALYEVAKITRREDLLTELANLRTRIRYGVRAELISLISLEGIGRVRARALYNAGFVTPSDLVKASPAKIAAVEKIGPLVAKKIKDQLMNRAAR